MKIWVITGQQNVDILEKSKDYNTETYKGGVLEFPEITSCHSYDLCEKILGLVHEYYEKDENLIIVTYSEIVLDAVRLWVARNSFECAECVNVLSDGNIINVPIDKNGEMEEWINGVFDIKQVILRELFEIRQSRK